MINEYLYVLKTMLYYIIPIVATMLVLEYLFIKKVPCLNIRQRTKIPRYHLYSYIEI